MFLYHVHHLHIQLDLHLYRLRATSLRPAALRWPVAFAALEPIRKRSRMMALGRPFDARSARLDIVTCHCHDGWGVTTRPEDWCFDVDVDHITVSFYCVGKGTHLFIFFWP